MEITKVILKDGIIVERRPFTLNVDKNRRYRILVEDKVVASNLLYSNIKYILPALRKRGKNNE